MSNYQMKSNYMGNSFNSSRPYNPNMLDTGNDKTLNTSDNRYRSNEKTIGINNMYIPTRYMYTLPLSNNAGVYTNENNNVKSSYHSSDPLRFY